MEKKKTAIRMQGVYERKYMWTKKNYFLLFYFIVYAVRTVVSDLLVKRCVMISPNLLLNVPL